jgi:hypothetical protein
MSTAATVACRSDDTRCDRSRSTELRLLPRSRLGYCHRMAVQGTLTDVVSACGDDLERQTRAGQRLWRARRRGAAVARCARLRLLRLCGRAFSNRRGTRCRDRPDPALERTATDSGDRARRPCRGKSCAASGRRARAALRLPDRGRLARGDAAAGSGSRSVCGDRWTLDPVPRSARERCMSGQCLAVPRPARAARRFAGRRRRVRAAVHTSGRGTRDVGRRWRVADRLAAARGEVAGPASAASTRRSGAVAPARTGATGRRHVRACGGRRCSDR